MADPRKKKRLPLRVSEEELKQIQRGAAQEGLTVSEFVRAAALSRSLDVVVTEELVGAREDL